MANCMYTAWGSMVCNSQQRPIFEKYQNYEGYYNDDEVEEFAPPKFPFSVSIEHHRSDERYNFLFNLGKNKEKGKALLDLGSGDLKGKRRQVTLQEESGAKQIMPGNMTIQNIGVFANKAFGMADVRYANGGKVVPKINTSYTLKIFENDLPAKDIPDPVDCQIAAEDYLRRYPDVAKHPVHGKNPLRHFKENGKRELRIWDSSCSQAPAPTKCKAAEDDYLNRYKDVQKAGVGGWDHFMKHGQKEKRVWNSSLCVAPPPACVPGQQLHERSWMCWGEEAKKDKSRACFDLAQSKQPFATNRVKIMEAAKFTCPDHIDMTTGAPKASQQAVQSASTQQAKTTSTAPAQQARPAQPPIQQGASTQQARPAQPQIQQAAPTQQAKAPTAAEKAKNARAAADKAWADVAAAPKGGKAAAEAKARNAEAEAVKAEAEANANAPAQAPIQQTPTQTKQGKIGTISPYQNYEGYYDDDEVEQFAHCSYY
jgi:hypothetical protein